MLFVGVGRREERKARDVQVASKLRHVTRAMSWLCHSLRKSESYDNLSKATVFLWRCRITSPRDTHNRHFAYAHASRLIRLMHSSR